ncbi:MAG: putative toxin-antitoxin system toxin component, PIN family [Thiothrix sp.]
MFKVVIDTNVLISGLLKADTAPRRLLELCIDGKVRPLMGNALFSEYLDVLARESLFSGCAVSAEEREVVLDAFLAACQWINIYFRWRPNLRDEADNHLVELAIAGNASHIVTGNNRDFTQPNLTFPKLKIVSIRDFKTLLQEVAIWES